MALPFLRRKRAYSGPPGKRLYAVGDVHGRLDLALELLELIARDAWGRDREILLVFLGDLIDRGPNSRGVLELARGQPLSGARTLCLKGNHEEMFARGLGGEASVLPQWLDYGGYECAQSYGVEVGALFGRSPEELEATLLQAVPASHIRFAQDLPDSIRFGDYVLAHAGVRPGVKLEDQTPRDLRWIREGFLESEADFGFRVVHGHSISLQVEERANRICVDTGAYMSGVLTACWIDGAEVGFLQARDRTRA
jgi:serine/threonine protein phosphatase 1